ncbi:MAG TPA: hypothetical protein VHD36_12215 [Pirellulales bacterium]|nr:hypothetical protein [Pirellulales bacterium]
MLSILREIDRRDRVLSRLGWFQVALLALMLLAMPLDQRTILGLNPWIKPAKFAASIAIYVWTLAWFLPYLSGPAWAKGLIRWGTVVTMITEIVCIAGQSLRGTPSHFNNTSAFNSAVFGIMGSMILFSTGLDVLLLVLFFRRHIMLPAPYLWGIRTGIAGVILAAGIGLLMVARDAHSVGGPDGGPGLPVLNWNTQHGDLRPAHAVALHALQILPLAGFLVSRFRAQAPVSVQLATFGACLLVYATITGLLLNQALEGRPLLRRTLVESKFTARQS